MPFFLFSRRRKNRERISKIRDEAPTHVEALARLFTDSQILDDGTLLGRVQAILEATEHRFVPGLHTGILFGQNGFREEFLDPWQASSNQVGHFLTAVRLAFDPKFLSNPALFFLLNSWQHKNIPVRLIVGHEKAADPPNADQPNWATFRSLWNTFRMQYQAATAEDIENFLAGKLDLIKVGTGAGNSLADLRLSYKGWLFGRLIVEERFQSKPELGDWIRKELGAS